MQPALPLRHDRLQRLLEYWHGKRAGKRTPLRAAVDPLDIPNLLPHLMLTEPIDGGADSRYRLVGTARVEAAGLDFPCPCQNQPLPQAPHPHYSPGTRPPV